jgi:hypothetical protein
VKRRLFTRGRSSLVWWMLATTGVVGAAGAAAVNLYQSSQSAAPAGQANPAGTGAVTPGAGSPSPAVASNAAKPDDKDKDKDKDKKHFSISGVVSGLYPGVAGKSLSLSLVNDDKFAIKVESLVVTVANAPSGCSATNILLGTDKTPQQKTFATNVAVPGNGQGTYAVPVTMAATAPSSCAGTTFTLSYSGTAVKA